MAGNQGHRYDWISAFRFYMNEVEAFRNSIDAFKNAGDTIMVTMCGLEVRR
jgi:chloramphenicol O-acetyltransferase type B